jgi:hypothetical protein
MSPTGPFSKLPRPPRRDSTFENNSLELFRWFDQIWNILGGLPGIGWELLSKDGSKLSDIESRPHTDLEDIKGGSEQFHVQESEMLELSALDGIASGIVAKTGDASYSAREIAGTLGKVDVAGGSGVSANPTINLPDVITGGQKFGSDDTNNSEFESDGTLKFNGTSTVNLDIFFPMAPPKTTGVGNPSLVTWNGNLRGFAFAVGDAHDFDAREFDHNGKEGSTGVWHIHFVTRSTIATDTAVNWQLEYSQANRNAVFPAPTTVSFEAIIPGGTPALTHFAVDIASFTTGNIASQMHLRLTRIASVGAAPAVDPVVSGVHYHYEVDTVGSRQMYIK